MRLLHSEDEWLQHLRRWNNMPSYNRIKGDGNDGEPDARRKLELEKKTKNWLELKNHGWFGMIFENIKSDPIQEVRGQS